MPWFLVRNLQSLKRPLLCVYHIIFLQQIWKPSREDASLSFYRQEKGSLRTCSVHTCCKVLGFVAQVPSWVIQRQGPRTPTAVTVFLLVLMFFPMSDVLVYSSLYSDRFAYILSWALISFCRRRFGRNQSLTNCFSWLLVISASTCVMACWKFLLLDCKQFPFVYPVKNKQGTSAFFF